MNDNRLDQLAEDQRSQAEARHEAAELLARVLMAGEEVHPLDALKTLHLALPTLLWTEVCERMGICPVHLRDEEACADDELECEAGQGPVQRQATDEELATWVQRHTDQGHDATYTTVAAPGFGRGTWCHTCRSAGPSKGGILSPGDVR